MLKRLQLALLLVALPACAQVTISGIAVASGQLTCGPPLAETPTFSPGANTYASAQTVTISTATPGATIYYTTDGTTPTTSSSVYSAPVNVPTTRTVQAIAAASGYGNSAVGSAEYIINGGSFLPAPTSINFGSITVGTTSAPQIVTLNNTTSSSGTISGAAISGADAADFAIASTTCGSTLSPSSSCTYSLTYSPTAVESDAAVFGVTLNGSPFSITLNGTGVASGVITFSPAPGTYTSAQAITLSGCDAGQNIFYRTDGNASETTIASAEYSSPIPVSSTQTITARCATVGARQSNLQASSTGSACHTLHGGTWGSLTCSSSGGVTGSPTDVTWDFGSTSHETLSQAANISGETQVLYTWLYGGNADPSAPTCDSCTEQTEDIVIEPTAGNAVIANNEMDMPQYDYTHSINRQNGFQCNQQSGTMQWQVDSGNAGGWTNTGIACNLAANTQYEIVKRVDHVIGDTGCGGHGCANYKFVCVNGTCSTLGGTYGNTQGYSAQSGGKAWGRQDQIDMKPTGSSAVTAGRNILFATVALGYGDETAVQSAAYTITAGTVATPTIAPTAGTYGYTLAPALSDATSGASILFTLDGTTPASTSTASSGGGSTFTVPACTINVIANSASSLSSAFSSASAGAVICVPAGTYDVTSTLRPANSGTASNWITVTAATPESVVNLVWTGGSTGDGGGLIQNQASSNWGPSYWVFQGLTLNGNNYIDAGFACNYSHHLKFLYNTIANAGAAGITAVHCDYLDSEHNIVAYSGYNQGWASGIDYGLLGKFDAYTGFHNIMAFNVVSGEYDGSTHHSDGNGFIVDDGGAPSSTDPATLRVGNVAYGNGGRGFACDFSSNVWDVNNTSYANGLDTAQSANSEFSNNGCSGVFWVNNLAYSWNSNAPFWITGTTSGLTNSGNIYYGGSNSGVSGGGFTSADPAFVSPTAVSSPAYSPGTAGQYANTLPASTGLLSNLWIQPASAAQGAGVNPTTLTSNGNLITDMTPYISLDINGITRSLTSITVGAYQYPSGTTFTYGTPFWVPTNTTVKAIGVKSGMSNSSTLSSSYTISVP